MSMVATGRSTCATPTTVRHLGRRYDRLGNPQQRQRQTLPLGQRCQGRQHLISYTVSTHLTHLMFVSASRLSDRARVWVERSPQDDNIDAIMATLFGPSHGSSAVEVAAREGRRGAPADGRHFCPLRVPIRQHPEVTRRLPTATR